MTPTAIEETIAALDLDEPIPCESIYKSCRNRGSHSADWWALSPCGSSAAPCERRRRALYEDGHWWCNGHEEQAGDIVWVPIRD